MTYYSPFNSTVGTGGKSLSDYGSASLAVVTASSPNYSTSGSYVVGDIVSYNNGYWKCIQANSGGTQVPPDISLGANTYWEYLGSGNSFTWIAYASSPDGTLNFTTTSFDDSGIIRNYIGTATNKLTATESTTPSDYVWSKFNGGQGLNRANIAYSAFPVGVATPTLSASGSGTAAVDTAIPTQLSGVGSLKLSTNTTTTNYYTYFGGSATDWNVDISGGKVYLLSAYVKSSIASASGSIRARTNDTSLTSFVVKTFTTSATIGTWTLVYGVFTAPADATKAILRVGVNVGPINDMWFAGIMLEEVDGTNANPSSYVQPYFNGRITASTTSTFIESLNANVITAGTINTDRLNIGGTTIEKNPTSGYLQIKALGVDTPFIANNAATVPSSVFTAGNISCPDSTETTVQSLSVTTTGATIFVIFSIQIKTTTGIGSFFNINFYRGTTLLYTARVWANTAGSIEPINSSSLSDAPGAGTYTYSIKVSPVGTGSGAVTANRSLLALEAKK